MPTTYSTPGVYIQELDAFPPSIVGVQSAIPAFIGYTEQALLKGSPVPFTPIRLTCLADYEAIFGQGPDGNFDCATVTSSTAPYDFAVGSTHYELTQAAATKFNLYSSMKLFFANGGGNCYVVSVGDYSGGVSKDALLKGITAIGDQVGPTMLLAPDAIHLPAVTPANPTDLPTSTDFDTVVTSLLGQCGKLGDRVALLDVYGTEAISPATQTSDIAETILNFRTAVQSDLEFGIAYFPFLESTLVSPGDLDYRVLKGTGSTAYSAIQAALNAEAALAYAHDAATLAKVQALVTAMSDATVDVGKNNQALLNALPLLAQIYGVVADKLNLLPPSAAMAGVITANDANRGVWNAPANVSLASVSGPSIKVTSDQQSDLNVPIDGKAVNAIREFVGRGTVVWGARTLDGNSPDWRYVQVRRAIIYIEQSIKAALQQYVFAPNDAQTWVTVTSMISTFLQSVWAQGGLMGAKASDAFSVQCGIGSTMTGQDVLDGYMRVQVTLQMIRPAEFIVLTFKQQMQGV